MMGAERRRNLWSCQLPRYLPNRLYSLTMIKSRRTRKRKSMTTNVFNRMENCLRANAFNIRIIIAHCFGILRNFHCEIHRCSLVWCHHQQHPLDNGARSNLSSILHLVVWRKPLGSSVKYMSSVLSLVDGLADPHVTRVVCAGIIPPIPLGTKLKVKGWF
mmetsp:Transcript_11275/g.18015  ORF Transcript_11275/g.18015 Transcript_11275/m.18015 type:complete len:160 (+) Transcript_11275:575-1054(+)